METIYKHPEGLGQIAFDAQTCRLFVFNEHEYLSAWACIGPDGLRNLAHCLFALANTMGVAQ
ncbi:MAG: hypothetical protein BGO13_02495 [Burkholderiales bacterium 66-5]|nr:MAG: hypothetical protein BGO13_02495 [Burkholderiales bacterium 66-5]